ncbi:hypothetical protein RIF29_25348 [Crotalaria pallida]|uniref:SHSP domain-containing protein n=1 Tax=Crotalaria pallida TaxID=3830 RepID=A0AAN9I106_CROPI
MYSIPSYVPPAYEDVEPKYESKETPESHLLIVHIPDGFAREHIGAKVEFDLGRVRVFGERPLGNNKISRFNVVYKVPATCDINGIKGKFDGGIVTITMQKKVISKEVPNQEQPTKQETPKPSVQETEPNPEENKEGIPSQSAARDDSQAKSTAADKEKDQKVQEGISSQDSNAKVQSKEEDDHDTSNIPKATEKSINQKGRESISGQDPKSTVESNEQVKQGTSNLAEATTEESKNQKGQDENERVVKEVTKQDTKSTSESGNQPKMDVVERVVKEVTNKEEDSPATEKEIKEERKESSKVEESYTKKEKENEKKRKGNFDNEADDEDESYGKGIKRIKEVAASASQAVTNMAKRFNEEDKQKLIYVGAAVVVVALGVYASYKFRSSPRL